MSQSKMMSATNEDREQLRLELIPGTEILTDNGTTSLVHEGDSRIVLVPQPANDPNDPLNWSRFWKYITLLNCSLYMFLGNFSALSIAPLTPIYEHYFNKTVTQIGLLTGACVLSLGYANLIIIPCTRLFGRRPVALICGLISIVAHIWQAQATSYGSLLGGRVLIGFAAATSESLMPVVVTDLLFLHQRGTWMGIYFWVFFMGAWAGPIVSGNVAANPHLGWRWFFRISAILQGVLLISMIFLFPETKFKRESATSQYRQQGTTPEDLEFKGESTVGELCYRNEDIHASGVPEPRPGSDQVTTPSVAVNHGYPSSSQRWSLNLKPDRSEFRFLPRDFVTPFQIATYPIVIFAACCVGFGANSLLVLNLLESPGFSRPPYNFSPSAVGFVNFALMGGGMFGLATAGPLSDWVSMKLTVRNGGIREPEMRLLTLIPFAIIGFCGLLISGLGWEKNWPWPVIIVIGFGFTGILIVAIPTIGLAYAIDSYKPVAGQITVVATVVKNTFGFGMTYFINNLADEEGYLTPIMLLASLSVGIPILGTVFFWFYGKPLRRLTRNSKTHNF